MVKKQWQQLLITFIFSLISFCVLIISISTNHWINAKAKNSIVYSDSEISYGLFHGSLTRYYVSSGQKFDLTVTCNYRESACMYSCQKTLETRQDELNRVLEGKSLTQCTISNARNLRYYRDVNEIPNKEIQTNNGYINSGFWVSTVSFLIISIIFAFISGSFSIINIYLNPIERILSVFGLYIWNSVCAVSILLTLAIWGGLYANFLKFNISITDTLNPEIELTFNSSGLASLGYSYFVLLISLFLHIGNIGIIYRREYVVNKEIPPPTIDVDKSDPTAIFF